MSRRKLMNDLNMNPEDRLASLEAEARQLEVSSEQQGELTRLASEYAQQFVAGLDQAQTYVAGSADPADWPPQFDEQGSDTAALIQQIASKVDHLGINPASGGHMGYIPGGGIFCGDIRLWWQQR